jgi:UDP-N-acetylmuramoyl-L-alanyl-D-glutamate--2,6-diaminopimelate ligase
MGQKAGFFSTVQFSTAGDALWNPEHQTTPEANIVQRLLYEMAENKASYAVIEASSHGLSLRTGRLKDVDFDAAVFTTITHEHLEFHGSWEQYRYDKANLFRALNNTMQKKKVKPFGVINADDPSAEYIAEAAKQKTVSFSIKGSKADLSIKTIESGSLGNSYEVFAAASNETFNIKDRLPGAFNAANVLAALLTVSSLLDIPVREIAPKIIQLKPVRGRMNRIERGQPYEVLVDYAHTPSSFQAIFPALRERFNRNKGRIISVFGSAGERDIKKRSEQGKIAANYSDIVILTDEDPRGEDPMAILEEIEKGCLASSACLSASECKKTIEFIRDKNLFLIPNRFTAIRKALSLAKPYDLVIFLGKGHENSIIQKTGPIPYDEILEVEKALSEIGY